MKTNVESLDTFDNSVDDKITAATETTSRVSFLRDKNENNASEWGPRRGIV